MTNFAPLLILLRLRRPTDHPPADDESQQHPNAPDLVPTEIPVHKLERDRLRADVLGGRDGRERVSELARHRVVGALRAVRWDREVRRGVGDCQDLGCVEGWERIRVGRGGRERVVVRLGGLRVESEGVSCPVRPPSTSLLVALQLPNLSSLAPASASRRRAETSSGTRARHPTLSQVTRPAPARKRRTMETENVGYSRRSGRYTCPSSPLVVSTAGALNAILSVGATTGTSAIEVAIHRVRRGTERRVGRRRASMIWRAGELGESKRRAQGSAGWLSTVIIILRARGWETCNARRDAQRLRCSHRELCSAHASFHAAFTATQLGL